MILCILCDFCCGLSNDTDRVNCHYVARFTAPVDVAKDAILVAKETLSTERPSFEIGQFSDVLYAISLFNVFATCRLKTDYYVGVRSACHMSLPMCVL